MDTQDTNPGSSAQIDNLHPVSTQFATPPAIDPELKEFIWHYCDPVYTCIARLTGFSDLDALEHITGQVILDLWNQRGVLLKEQRPGICIFKILLQQVFIHLKQHGNEARIRLLQSTLLNDLACYDQIIKTEKRPLKAVTPSYFLHKIKRLWKTF
jgi:hypothetical protein